MDSKIAECSERWIPITEQLPPEHTKVMTKIDDGRGVRNEQHLYFHSNLWWTGSGGNAMYVYYTPTHWRPAAASQPSEVE